MESAVAACVMAKNGFHHDKRGVSASALRLDLRDTICPYCGAVIRVLQRFWPPQSEFVFTIWIPLV